MSIGQKNHIMDQVLEDGIVNRGRCHQSSDSVGRDMCEGYFGFVIQIVPPLHTIFRVDSKNECGISLTIYLALG